MPKKIKTYRRQIRINGKMVGRTFSNKKDADDWYAMTRRKKELIENGLDIGFEAKKLKPWCGEWLSEKRNEIVDSTFRLYNDWLRNDVLPELGNEYMHFLSARDIQVFLFKIRRERGLANATYNRYRILLHGIFQAALMTRPRHVIENVINQVKALPENSKPIIIFDQKKDITTYLEGALEFKPWFYVAGMIFFNTGVRLGEGLALQIRDLDFDARKISVVKQKDYKTGRLKPYTKGKRNRWVPMNDALYLTLRWWIDTETPASDEDFLIRWAGPKVTTRWKNDGRSVSSSHFHYFHDQLISRLGLPSITVHQMRHTYGAHQADLDGHLLRLQGILGHQDQKTTERYARLLEERKSRPGFTVGKEIVEKIGKLKLLKQS